MRESEKMKLDLAAEQGYLLLKDKGGQRVKNAYWNWCNENERVFVCVRRGKQTSIIELDFYPIVTRHKFLTEEACEKYIEIALTYLGVNEGGYLFNDIKHIPNYELDMVLEDLLELIDNGVGDSRDESYSVDDILKRVSLSVQPKRRITEKREPEIAKQVKLHSHGICELCNKSAPFKDRNGNPYLEAHHIIWLSRGGYDREDNIAALCPNCHAKMHVLGLAEDVAILKDKVKRRIKTIW